MFDFRSGLMHGGFCYIDIQHETNYHGIQQAQHTNSENCGGSAMDQKTKSAICIGCLCLSLLMVASGLLLLFVGNADPFVNCFAVDGSGNVYLGIGDRIEVYANGCYQSTFSDLDCFSQISMKNALFTIEKGNTFLLVTESNLYYLDLQGNLIEKTDRSITLYNRLAAGIPTFTSAQGDDYRLVNRLGRTRIVKNGEQTVFRLPFAAFAVKITFSLAELALLFAVVVFCVPRKKRSKRRKPPIYPAGQH